MRRVIDPPAFPVGDQPAWTFLTTTASAPNPAAADAGAGVPADPATDSRSASSREIIERIIAHTETSMRQLRCAAADRLVRAGVSMTHLNILWQLEENGEIGMTRIADILGASMSNATGLIDRMEERGLVERVRLEGDRRVVHVRPTERGLEMLREIEVLRGDLVGRVLSRLSEEQLDRLARSVTDIINALNAEPTLAGA